jgi:hypothetical protein
MLLSQPIVILVSTCVIPHRIVLSLSSCYTKCLRKDNCEEQLDQNTMSGVLHWQVPGQIAPLQHFFFIHNIQLWPS